jgi:hypothetical protein
MSKHFFKSQKWSTVPYHDPPPQYDSCQPSQDLLTCVIENEHIYRALHQQLDDLNKNMEKFNKTIPKSANYILSSELLSELAEFFTEGSLITTELAKVIRERTFQNTNLYTAMSRLTISEFNRTYASLKRGPNRQIRFKLAEEIERIKDAPTKAPRSFWKRLFKHLARV